MSFGLSWQVSTLISKLEGSKLRWNRNYLNFAAKQIHNTHRSKVGVGAYCSSQLPTRKMFKQNAEPLKKALELLFFTTFWTMWTASLWEVQTCTPCHIPRKKKNPLQKNWLSSYWWKSYWKPTMRKTEKMLWKWWHGMLCCNSKIVICEDPVSSVLKHVSFSVISPTEFSGIYSQKNVHRIGAAYTYLLNVYSTHPTDGLWANYNLLQRYLV